MTTATQITLFRIFLIPVFIGLAIYYGESVVEGKPDESLRWWAIVVFAVASISDAVDGYIARHFNQRSRLGQILDPLADKALMFSALITLSFAHWQPHFPLWFPLIVIFRDLAVVCGWALVSYTTGTKIEVKPHWTGKTATFFLLASILWLMLDIRTPPLIWPTAIAALLTAASGLIYLAETIRHIQRHHDPAAKH